MNLEWCNEVKYPPRAVQLGIKPWKRRRQNWQKWHIRVYYCTNDKYFVNWEGVRRKTWDIKLDLSHALRSFRHFQLKAGRNLLLENNYVNENFHNWWLLQSRNIASKSWKYLTVPYLFHPRMNYKIVYSSLLKDCVTLKAPRNVNRRVFCCLLF